MFTTVAGILNKGGAAADCFHSFFLSLTEYIQAMILVNEATISNNLTLIKGMCISNPNLEEYLVFSVFFLINPHLRVFPVVGFCFFFWREWKGGRRRKERNIDWLPPPPRARAQTCDPLVCRPML